MMVPSWTSSPVRDIDFGGSLGKPEMVHVRTGHAEQIYLQPRRSTRAAEGVDSIALGDVDVTVLVGPECAAALEREGGCWVRDLP